LSLPFFYYSSCYVKQKKVTEQIEDFVSTIKSISGKEKGDVSHAQKEEQGKREPLELNTEGKR